MGRSVSAGSQCGLASTQVIIWVSLMRRLPHQNSPCIPRPGFLHPATLRCVPCDPSLFAPCLLGGARTPQAKLTAPRRGGRKSQGTRHWAGVNRKCATPCRTHLCVPISHVCSWLARHSGGCRHLAVQEQSVTPLYTASCMSPNFLKPLRPVKQTGFVPPTW